MPKNSNLRTESDNFQSHYTYELSAPTGKQFDPEFKPELTPSEMLALGVFGGAYFIGVPGLIPDDLPKSWFKGARLSKSFKKEKTLNFFGVHASQPLSVWQKKGWITLCDPHGWFQWYCRYYLGRRIPKEDHRQIGRWKAIRRHIGQLKKNCRPKDLACRPVQRQALLHWAYDSRKM